MTVKRERRSASGKERIWTKETEQIKNCAAAQFFLFLLAAFFTADQKDGDQYEDNRDRDGLGDCFFTAEYLYGKQKTSRMAYNIQYSHQARKFAPI